EETGHHVTVREFLGTLVYESGGRAKIVHFWSMEAGGEPTRALMNDVRAVDWLPLDAAVERLSRDHERVFLEAVGPLAIGAHARRLKARPAIAKEPAAGVAAAHKGRGAAVVPEPVPLAPASIEPVPDASSATLAAEPLEEIEAARLGVEPGGENDTTDPTDNRRRSLAQKVRGWFGRVAS